MAKNKLNEITEDLAGGSGKASQKLKQTGTTIEIENFELDNVITRDVNNKRKREIVSVYFYPDVMDKLKVLSVQYNSPISKVIEDCMIGITKNSQVDEKIVAEYDRQREEEKNNKKKK